jgi:hypothetical protein
MFEKLGANGISCGLFRSSGRLDIPFYMYSPQFRRGGPSVFIVVLDTILLLRVSALYRHNRLSASNGVNMGVLISDLLVFAAILILVLGTYISEWSITVIKTPLKVI